MQKYIIIYVGISENIVLYLYVLCIMHALLLVCLYLLWTINIDVYYNNNA